MRIAYAVNPDARLSWGGLPAPAASSAQSGPIRNHRVPLLGDGTSPDGHPRARTGSNGHEVTTGPLDVGYHNNAITIGGGSRVFGAQAWRFHPDDFRMASLYGVQDGSALADWTISYDDLAPFYRQVEWDLGVAAGPDDDFPMPPWPPGREGRILLDAAARLGWPATRVPLLINTQPQGWPRRVHPLRVLRRVPVPGRRQERQRRGSLAQGDPPGRPDGGRHAGRADQR